MGSLFPAAFIALLVSLLLPVAPDARMVYLKDGAVLKAEAAWRSDGKVTILVNHEEELVLPEREVNLKRTFPPRRVHHAIPTSRSVRKPSGPVQAPLSSSGGKPSKPADASTATLTPPSPPRPVPSAASPPSAPPASAQKPATPSAGPPATPPPASPAEKPVAQAPPPAPPTPAVPAPPAESPPVEKHPLPGANIPLQQIESLGTTTILAILVGILVLSIILIAAVWKVYEKAGQAGWKCLIPIYNYVVFLAIIEKPVWWVILLFIPLVSIIILIVMHVELAKRFGKGLLYGLGLLFLPFIFFPLLAFGDASYE